MTCLDALTGAVQYEGGRPPIPATFTSSLVAYGDRLLVTSEDGDTFVVKAGTTHEIIGTNSVGSRCMPHWRWPARRFSSGVRSICSLFDSQRSDEQLYELAQHHRRRPPDLVPAEIEVGVLDLDTLTLSSASPDP
jgi:hypothetical protein